MILCCGEALVDFLPDPRSKGLPSFQAFNGGSIYNVAIALGRLGRPVGFLGGLSQDFFGAQLRSGLEASCVNLNYAINSERSSTLAFVQFIDGEPSYAFVDEGSAGRMLQEADLPDLSGNINALHFGSISLIHEPAGATFEALAQQHYANKIISLDPNIRPGQVKDRAAYIARLKRLIAMSDIVKLSDVDLQWIAPNESIDAISERWIKTGAKLVVVTRGGNGAVGFSFAGKYECKPLPVTIADTIGAGDTFMAGLLAFFDGKGLLSTDMFDDIGKTDLQGALDFAARAAAVTVSRPGANPPWAEEL